MSSECSFDFAKIDSLAERILARAKPVRFGETRSEAELTAALRLRCQVAIEQGWARGEDFSKGLESDAYDDRAVQIVGWDASILAATARLVLPKSGRLQPTEEAFGIALNDRIVDIGRICVARAYRSMPPWVFLGLLGQSWLSMRARGFTDACGVMSASVARVYQSWGLKVIALAPPREYWGETRFPALVLPVASMHEALRHALKRAS